MRTLQRIANEINVKCERDCIFDELKCNQGRYDISLFFKKKTNVFLKTKIFVFYIVCIIWNFWSKNEYVEYFI